MAQQAGPGAGASGLLRAVLPRPFNWESPACGGGSPGGWHLSMCSHVCLCAHACAGSAAYQHVPVHMATHVCAFSHMCMHVPACNCSYTHIHTTQVYVSTCACTCSCMRAHMHQQCTHTVSACAHTCRCTCSRVHHALTEYSHVPTYVCTHTHMCVSVCSSVHVCVCAISTDFLPPPSLKEPAWLAIRSSFFSLASLAHVYQIKIAPGSGNVLWREALGLCVCSGDFCEAAGSCRSCQGRRRLWDRHTAGEGLMSSSFLLSLPTSLLPPSGGSVHRVLGSCWSPGWFLWRDAGRPWAALPHIPWTLLEGVCH